MGMPLSVICSSGWEGMLLSCVGFNERASKFHV